jgi:hypothetical protein
MANAPRKESPEGDWKLRGFAYLFSAGLIILCLVAGELVLRHWFPFEGVVSQRDARYLFRYIPNSRRRMLASEASGIMWNMLVINREGRVGEVVSNSRRPRIVVYGDSFIAAEHVPVRQTFVADLERTLQARVSKTTQVINAGVAGYGPDQESLVMEDEIDSLKPDLVIVAIFSGNDFGDLLRNKLFALDERQQLVARHPTLTPNLQAYFAQAESLSRFQIVRRSKKIVEVLRSGPLTQKIKRSLHVGHFSSLPAPPPRETPSRLPSDLLRDREAEYRNAVVDRDPFVDNLFWDDYDVDMSLEPGSPEARYKAILMKRVMERIQHTAGHRKVPCIFMIIPAASDTTDWSLPIDTAVYPEYRRSRVTDLLEMIAMEIDAPNVNLFRLFYEHRADDLYDHTAGEHWNWRGQKLAANAMADYIASRWFQPSAAISH